MNRLVWLGIVPMLLLAAASAQAQVAAPDLVPAAPRYLQPGDLGVTSATFTVDNPAALQWGKPSRAAFGIVKLTRSPTGGPDDKHSGYIVGYRGVSDGWAFGLEHLSVDQDNSSARETASSGHLAFQVLEGLALGAGLDQGKDDSGGGAYDKTDARTIGVSVNLKKVFFFGYAVGRDTFENDAGTTGGRDTSMYGVAIRPEGSWHWHLAYDKLDKGNFTNGVGRGFDLTTITIQVVASNVLVGAQQVTKDPKGGGSQFKATVIDAGWAPDHGLSVTGRLSDGKNTSAGATTETDKLMALVVGYAF
jgi:hypothetical protein